MPYYVYMILCEDNSLYTGYTKNVDSRMTLHVRGNAARYTKMHKPKRIVYVEEFASRAEAMKREKSIKKLSHKRKLKLVKTQNKQRRTRHH